MRECRTYALGGISGTSTLGKNIRDLAVADEVKKNPLYADGSKLNFRKFKIIVDADCDMVVNNGTPYPLSANAPETFEDVSVHSLVLNATGVTYKVGYYY